ncbi:MAG: glycosyltransferase family 2 protein [Sphingomonadales bacterium]|nr:glycosyltransferase family 2 protein [Sphingomonadales bacterium]
MQPLLSICIPSFQRPLFLKRLLDSIRIQTFTDFEVIISDDSADDSVLNLLQQMSYPFCLRYHKNEQSLGTPRNWVRAIELASGKWIKLMHDDDWLTDQYSLEHFVASISVGTDVLFSGYRTFNEVSKTVTDKTLNLTQFKMLQRNPYRLFAENIIGPPSVVLFRSDMVERYDISLKWLVDLEAYIRMIRGYSCHYISHPLITMGISDSQVTQSCRLNPGVEIPEMLYFYNKHGKVSAQTWIVYDAWWRIIRNLSIRNLDQLVKYSNGQYVPNFILQIIKLQSLIPLSLLRQGLISKLVMLFSYYFNR